MQLLTASLQFGFAMGGKKGFIRQRNHEIVPLEIVSKHSTNKEQNEAIFSLVA